MTYPYGRAFPTPTELDQLAVEHPEVFLHGSQLVDQAFAAAMRENREFPCWHAISSVFERYRANISFQLQSQMPLEIPDTLVKVEDSAFISAILTIAYLIAVEDAPHRLNACASMPWALPEPTSENPDGSRPKRLLINGIDLGDSRSTAGIALQSLGTRWTENLRLAWSRRAALLTQGSPASPLQPMTGKEMEKFLECKGNTVRSLAKDANVRRRNNRHDLYELEEIKCMLRAGSKRNSSPGRKASELLKKYFPI